MEAIDRWFQREVHIDVMEYPGKYCEKINLDKSCITSGKIPKLSSSDVNNGVVVELFRYASKSKLADKSVEKWITQLLPGVQSLKQSTFRARLKKVKETQRKFESKKKVKSFLTVEDFHTSVFFLNEKEQSSHEIPQCPSPMKETETQNVLPNCPHPVKDTETPNVLPKCPHPMKETETQNKLPKCPSPLKETETQNAPLPSSNHKPTEESLKMFNQLKYKVSNEQKKLNVLKSLVQNEKESLESLKSVKGHFSVRNVTKRDENAKSTRQSLRALKMSYSKQKHILETLKAENQELLLKVQQHQSENSTLTNDNDRLKDDNHKKTKAQKLASYYRGVLRKVRETDNSEVMKRELKKKQDQIEHLTFENESLREEKNKCVTKNADGSFSNNVRLCVMELFALEIGMEKIPCAIEAVCAHMFNYNFEKTELPTLTTVRSMVDEGHYLAKTYIAKQIEKADNIGISRDGTTRKKQKVVDTSITLDTGEIMSLGFTKVARETAEVINNVTKNQMTELGETMTGSDQQEKITEKFIAESLDKLSFTMSDRASNEKLADKLLNEWRDSVLDNCENDHERQTVEQFHCMAHVLLGFHRYVTDDLKKLEKELITSDGPVGRDKLPFFKFWSKKQTIIERISYTASGIFGPAGDHLGLRDRWEAYCASKGVKSLIGNYKDNRFNSLFQTSAEVFLHCNDFLDVIKTVQNPNQKIVSVEADLQSETVKTMLRALTTVYVRVTGPYWWLVTSGMVSYLELFPYIQSLETFLQQCTENPKLIDKTTWITDENLFIPHSEKFEHKLLTPVPADQQKLFDELITSVCKSMLRTVRKQLADFLKDGRYGSMPSKEDLARTAFAQVNNLACEHHFGDLDSSQRRRPNATFHHHSSVQMLKRNRRKLISWLSEMPINEQKELMKKARKGGIDLRKRHREQEENVQSEVLCMMEKGQKAKRRKVVERDCENDSGDDYENGVADLKDMLPNMESGFCDNEYVAVAYQDGWYPGCVMKSVSCDKAEVNFMVPCRKPGTFMWPSRKDCQVVEKEFVIKRGMVPECCNSGRQWYFSDHKIIVELFEKYKQNFFM